jgi:hypothetical protein
MKGSQGLEALAALCGGQSEAPITVTSSTSTILPVYNSSAAQQTIFQAAQRAATASSQQQQQSQQYPLSNLKPPQWQQFMATATAALQSSGVNPTLAVHNFLLAAAAQNSPPPVDNSAFAAMQQMAYLQYTQAQANVAAQQQAVQQQAVQTMAGNVNVDPTQAMAMALAGKAQQQQRTQGHGGKSHDHFLFICIYCQRVFVRRIMVVFQTFTSIAQSRFSMYIWLFSSCLLCDIFI